MGNAKKKHWSYSTGERGRNRVRAFERPATGLLFVEFYEVRDGSDQPMRKRIALGHRDRDRAKQQADEVAAKFAKPEAFRERLQRKPTLEELFDIYLREVTPEKSSNARRHDRSCAQVMLRFFGEHRTVASLSRRDWDRFIHARRSGTIKMPRWSKPRPIGNTQIAHDLKFLRAVLNWAMVARDGQGEVLLERDPLKGLPMPKEESPNRPMITAAEYQAMRAIARNVNAMFEVALVLAHETGHRIGAIRALRWSDVDFSRRMIRWRAENDKSQNGHETMLSDEAVGVLERARAERPAIGDAWIFPDPADASQHVDRYVTEDWWNFGEGAAGLARVKGRGWHSLRRNFATEMKDMPLKDLAHLGGWKDTQTILKCYQRPDEVTMRNAFARRRPFGAAPGAAVEPTPRTDTA